MESQQVIFDDGTFRYDGVKYMSYTALQYRRNGVLTSLQLTNSRVESIHIETQVGRLYSKGFIIYDDTIGDVSKVLGKFELELMVVFHPYYVFGDGMVFFDIPDLKNQLMHWFTVDNVEILESGDGNIKYCLHLTGVEHRRLLNHVMYSDYQNENPKTIVQIIKEILDLHGKFNLDDSFDKVMSGVTLKYISNGNDTVQSSVDYLLQKQLFFGHIQENGMKVLTYDILNEKIGIFQLGHSKPDQIYNVVFSTNNSQVSEFISSSDIKLKTDSTMSKSEIFQAISNMRMRSFNLETNGFDERTITSGQIIRFFGGGTSNSILLPMTDGTESYMVREYSEWDNCSSVYKDLLETFMGWDSVIVETGGIIGRKLMEMVNVSIDNMVETPMNATTEQAKQDSERYDRMQGLWYITGITHVIRPSEGKYTQKLHLSRVD